jgi:hypothetical protein
LQVQAQPGDGTLVVSWSGGTGVTGYRVGRSGTETKSTGGWSTVDGPGNRSRTFLLLSNGTEHTFYVEALNGQQVVASGEVKATPTST